ncbi:hypothetical protein TraAM80_00428 [Trypanosoma rangeli]|uniref:Uncharacterized protein n=1 Tax=Trypanosoma rangeli TaxID=5698 RepID=A0A3S5ISM9_TRYRA|nr:uncharacterized protein TraAM80_00428 [Trypanosoma rangeli]RNF12280.1 hypothetical protein TraAM80_00428 [Trypanosoma rangeli]|eukprot:RNF12280.1 hypothetical protein TraAM80_00428 [Trypanosoma rangeli]
MAETLLQQPRRFQHPNVNDTHNAILNVFGKKLMHNSCRGGCQLTQLEHHHVTSKKDPNKRQQYKPKRIVPGLDDKHNTPRESRPILHYSKRKIPSNLGFIQCSIFV